MRLLPKEELTALMEVRAQPCISVYLPTEGRGDPNQQNPLRFKNQIKVAEQQLESLGFKPHKARALLQPALELDTSDFWQYQSDGLAIFVAPDFFCYYRLPHRFAAQVVVSDHPYIKPLLPLLTNDGPFYILALSQRQVRLLEGDRYSVHEIHLEDMPLSLSEALRYDEPEQKQFQYRTGTPAAAPEAQPGVFHGQGMVTEDHKEELERFFHQVNAGLHDYLREKKVPLVLAGVEYLLPIYRAANTYPHLIPESLTGNPDDRKPFALHEQVWPLVAPIFAQAQQRALEQYEQRLGSGSASGNLEEIVSGAYFSRVQTLFVPIETERWGVFDAEANRTHLHAQPEPGDHDLLDLAALHTLRNGGEVYVVPAIPDFAPLAAIFRY
ncbi:baeRF3 domain-containing protein [Anthocerotibacter panamensis]|uniref:baeRF3 domain-containing protein n=1 Tax=Anthocerotibacter panamensis TaxID=2857077 RepID=UPI001C405B0D|nr:hypothetical protein [Anthocerotibacter panamensis]